MSQRIDFKCPRCGVELAGQGSYESDTGRMTIAIQSSTCQCYLLTALPTALYLAAGSVYMKMLVDQGTPFQEINQRPIQR